MKKTFIILFLLFSTLEISFAEESLDFSKIKIGDDAKHFVRQAFDYWRGKTSILESKMKVVRPDWQREFELSSWTSGNDHSLVRFSAPIKDAGNATLTLKQKIWSYNPKTRRVIKIPPSMKAQSWMGSDFSYQDLAREDEVVTDYSHKVIEQSKDKLVVESTPNESAPVVWGKEVITIGSNKILLQLDFYDQDDKLVKTFKTEKVGIIGNRLFPVLVKMTKIEEDNSWTEMSYENAKFDVEIPKQIFSVSRLQNSK